MKINEKILKKEIENLIDINAININVADMLMTAFSYTDIFDPNDIKQYVKEGFSEEEAIITVLYDFYGLNKDDEDNAQIMEEYFLKCIHKLEPTDYLNNPYVKAIKKQGRTGKYALKEITYAPYQLFASDEIVVKNYHEYSQVGYFSEEFSYLALCEGNNIWMSLNPNEINTMQPYIDEAKGDVLILGLGMGYVPFMLANKDDVKRIVIIERDQQIIDLFNLFIWPDFPNQEKVTIIKDDAIRYTSDKQRCQSYDYIFADLWHEPNDGLDIYLSLKKNEQIINKKIHYWLETSIIALLRRCMITLIEETLFEHLDDNAYRHAKTATDKVINHYYFQTKNLALNNKEDLDHLLSDENLVKLTI